MINKIQTKMITHILKDEKQREEDLLSKIKVQKSTNKFSNTLNSKTNNKNSTSKKKKFKEEKEEYKFIATESSVNNEKEEKLNKSNTFLSKNKLQNSNKNLIQVRENVFINESNINQLNNYSYKLNQQQEYYDKSINDRTNTNNYNYNNNNNNYTNTNEYIDSNNSMLRRSIKRRKSASPGVNVFINNMRNSSFSTCKNIIYLFIIVFYRLLFYLFLLIFSK